MDIGLRENIILDNNNTTKINMRTRFGKVARYLAILESSINKSSANNIVDKDNIALTSTIAEDKICSECDKIKSRSMENIGIDSAALAVSETKVENVPTRVIKSCSATMTHKSCHVENEINLQINKHDVERNLIASTESEQNESHVQCNAEMNDSHAAFVNIANTANGRRTSLTNSSSHSSDEAETMPVVSVTRSHAPQPPSPLSSPSPHRPFLVEEHGNEVFDERSTDINQDEDKDDNQASKVARPLFVTFSDTINNNMIDSDDNITNNNRIVMEGTENKVERQHRNNSKKSKAVSSSLQRSHEPEFFVWSSLRDCANEKITLKPYNELFCECDKSKISLTEQDSAKLEIIDKKHLENITKESSANNSDDNGKNDDNKNCYFHNNFEDNWFYEPPTEVHGVTLTTKMGMKKTRANAAAEATATMLCPFTPHNTESEEDTIVLFNEEVLKEKRCSNSNCNSDNGDDNNIVEDNRTPCNLSGEETAYTTTISTTCSDVVRGEGNDDKYKVSHEEAKKECNEACSIMENDKRYLHKIETMSEENNVQSTKLDKVLSKSCGCLQTANILENAKVLSDRQTRSLPMPLIGNRQTDFREEHELWIKQKEATSDKENKEKLERKICNIEEDETFEKEEEHPCCAASFRSDEHVKTPEEILYSQQQRNWWNTHTTESANYYIDETELKDYVNCLHTLLNMESYIYNIDTLELTYTLPGIYTWSANKINDNACINESGAYNVVELIPHGKTCRVTAETFAAYMELVTKKIDEVMNLIQKK